MKNNNEIEFIFLMQMSISLIKRPRKGFKLRFIPFVIDHQVLNFPLDILELDCNFLKKYTHFIYVRKSVGFSEGDHDYTQFEKQIWEVLEIPELKDVGEFVVVCEISAGDANLDQRQITPLLDLMGNESVLCVRDAKRIARSIEHGAVLLETLESKAIKLLIAEGRPLSIENLFIFEEQIVNKFPQFDKEIYDCFLIDLSCLNLIFTEVYFVDVFAVYWLLLSSTLDEPSAGWLSFECDMKKLAYNFALQTGPVEQFVPSSSDIDKLNKILERLVILNLISDLSTENTKVVGLLRHYIFGKFFSLPILSMELKYSAKAEFQLQYAPPFFYRGMQFFLCNCIYQQELGRSSDPLRFKHYTLRYSQVYKELGYKAPHGGPYPNCAFFIGALQWLHAETDCLRVGSSYAGTSRNAITGLKHGEANFNLRHFKPELMG